MNRFVIFLALLLVGVYNARACDVCGCSGTSFYVGVLPQFQKHFIGLRYRVQAFDTRLSQHQPGLSDSREQFRVVDVWARFYPLRRVQVLAMLPYQFHTQTQADAVRHVQGIGDATLLASYNVLNVVRMIDSAHVVKHSLLLGAGTKLATGRYRYDDADGQQVANPNFQPGTGATDWLLSGIYTYRRNRFGINVEATGRLTGTNADGYRFGNRVNGSVMGFYVQQWKRVGVMPSLGLYGEYSRKDHKHGVLIAETGGYLVAAAAGLDVYRGNWAMGFNAQLPIRQHLSEGLVTSHARAGIHLSRMF